MLINNLTEKKQKQSYFHKKNKYKQQNNLQYSKM